MSTLGILINNNTDIETKKMIVGDHATEEKQTIQINMEGGFSSSEEHIYYATSLVNEEIKKNIRPEIYDIICMPAFTCSKPIHNLMGNILIM